MATPESHPSPVVAPPAEAQTIAMPPAPPVRHSKHHWLGWTIVGSALLLLIAVFGLPWLHELLTTVSTDDAYVNSHVTFVAPRVAGQVARVLVDDNNRVRRGDVLVQLDRESFEVSVQIATAAVAAASADLDNARAQARGTVGQARSARFSLDRAIEEVHNQVALLHAKVADVNAAKAVELRAQADFDRANSIAKTDAIAASELDKYQQVLTVAQAQVEEALQGVYQVRVALGLPPKPASGDDLTQVPSDIDETFSAVREAQANVIHIISQLGVEISFNKTPRQMIEEFYQRDPSGDINKIYAKLLLTAPGVVQAQTKLAEAQRNLDLANLNLRYCDVVAEIDGVVTRRSVNPGNNVVAGQSLMAIRSLDEIWVDANFKETQLADLRIGHPVDLDVDMYGSRKRFRGRISGFTMGTGSTLALLPAENATGNFVKVVQRVPVRIELLDYQPDVDLLIVGTSVTATVHYHQQPTGDNAGKLLQPTMATTVPTTMP